MRYVVFEGCDGSGKSTNLSMVKDRLTEEGYNVVIIREPGGTMFGERLRDLIFNIDCMAGHSELMQVLDLLAINRRELDRALKAFELKGVDYVLSDRNWLTSMVMQIYPVIDTLYEKEYPELEWVNAYGDRDGLFEQMKDEVFRQIWSIRSPDIIAIHSKVIDTEALLERGGNAYDEYSKKYPWDVMYSKVFDALNIGDYYHRVKVDIPALDCQSRADYTFAKIMNDGPCTDKCVQIVN